MFALRRPLEAAPDTITRIAGLLTHTPSPDLIYSDKRPEDIDALPRDARHKAVNDVIKRAVDDGRLNRSQVAIIIPPLIYGTGIGCVVSLRNR